MHVDFLHGLDFLSPHSLFFIELKEIAAQLGVELDWETENSEEDTKCSAAVYGQPLNSPQDNGKKRKRTKEREKALQVIRKESLSNGWNLPLEVNVPFSTTQHLSSPI